MKLSEVKALVTGATSGIGYEIASALKAEGASVIISGRNQEKLDKACQALDVLGLKADVRNEEEVEAMIQFAIQTWGSFNVLINNAGFGKFASLVETSVEDFQYQWEVNTKGLFMAGKAAAQHFIENKNGNIINIGSTVAKKGMASGSGYVASKFAVSGLTECWRAELRPHNIRVMQVNPSEVVTDFFEKAGFEQKDTEKKLKTSEIAHLVVAMLSMNSIGFIPEASVWATNPW
ncbi:MAG: SDR family oxidoreductase [Flavobacteriales bacterium]